MLVEPAVISNVSAKSNVYYVLSAFFVQHVLKSLKNTSDEILNYK